jgi:exopolysaccharide biosynthesis polyprenyl glycosylphosphotransferase
VPVLVLGEFPLLGWNGFLKRAMDIALSGTGLVLLAPCFAALAVLVKLTSRGPVFYRQLRVGRDGRRFQMVKFRTMRTDAEAAGPVAAARKDPRVTKVGGVLRRLSLDELPQLANVLVGEMSLVGPRPERPQFVGHLANEIPNYLGRLRVKSGMTGWAQIHGLRGGESSMMERVRCDLYYIEHWSLALDLMILCRTVFSLHRQRNAY